MLFCVIPENIHTSTTEGHLEIRGEAGVLRAVLET